MSAVHEYLAALSELLLPGVRPYIVLASDNPPRELLSPRASGFTGQMADVWFESWLESRGLWQGRRAFFYVDDSGLANEAEPIATDWVGRAWQADMWHTVAAIAVHELGHIADLPTDARPITPRVVQDATDSLEFAKIDADRSRPRADYHGPKWLRIVAHLWHRARKAGHNVDTELIYASNYGTPPLSNTTLALEYEVEALESTPIERVNDIAPPSEFIGLWEFKLRKWRAEQPDDDTDADRIVSRSLTELAAIGRTTIPAAAATETQTETPCIAAHTLEHNDHAYCE